MGVHLLEFNLMRRDRGSGAIKDQKSRARGALVNRANEPGFELVLFLLIHLYMFVDYLQAIMSLCKAGLICHM